MPGLEEWPSADGYMILRVATVRYGLFPGG